MTKAELIEAVARSSRQKKKVVAMTLEVTFDQIARAIRKDKRFWMPGFGTFLDPAPSRAERLQSSNQCRHDDSGCTHDWLSPRAAAQRQPVIDDPAI